MYRMFNGRKMSTTQPLLFHSSSKILPASKTVADACCIPFGFLYDPFVAVEPPLPYITRNVPRCPVCNGYINKYCRVTAQSWNCIFCKKENKISIEYQVCNNSSMEELAYESYEFPAPNQDLPQGFQQDSTKHIIFIIDDYLESNEKLIALDGIIKYIEDSSDNTTISLILMSSVANVFMLNQNDGNLTTEAFSGNASMTQDLHKYMSDHGRFMMTNLATSRQKLLDNLRTMYHATLSKFEMMNSTQHFLTNRKGPRKSVKVTPKCLGFALELIISLFKQDSHCNMLRHVFVLASGYPSHGPGAVANESGEMINIDKSKQYFSSIGTTLAKSRCSLHMFCIGNEMFGVAAMENMIQNSGGTLLMFKEIPSSLYEDILYCIESVIGYNGVIRLQTTDNVVLNQVVATQTEQLNKTVYSKRYPVTSKSSKISGTFGFSSRLNSTPVFLQCSNSYTSCFNGVKMVRVTTIRYDCTADQDEIIAACDTETAFALRVREYLEHLYSKQESTDLLTRQAHTLITNSQTSFNANVKVLTQQLLEKLYFLKHGPLVSRMLQHRDDKDYLLHVMLHGDIETVTHLVKPKVYNISLSPAQGSNISISIVEYPAVTLVLRPNRIILLDTYTDIYLWIGYLVQNRVDLQDILEQCHLLIRQLCNVRFPKPRLSLIQDGTSMNRFVECYLMPIHNDPKEIQVAILPELNDLKEEEYEELLAKYRHIHRKTLSQWLNEMRLVVVSNLPT